MRLIIAAVMIGAALFTYFSQTEVNPVTKKKQHVAMSKAEEVAMGLQSTPEMVREMGGEERGPMADLVDRIGRKVLMNSSAQNHPDYRDHFRFHLLHDQKTINAFALPGGQVFITRALLERLQNEAQLAGVLGHEIGHVIGRHASEQMAKGRLGESIAQGVGVAAGDNNAHMMAQKMNGILQLGFSRSHENEADNFGFDFMTEAGYDPREMLGVMEILKSISAGGRQPEFLTTHPYPEHRIQHINELLAKKFPKGVPSNLSKGATFKHNVEAPDPNAFRPRRVQ